MRYCKPSFINPNLLEDQRISLVKLLEDEAAGMAFPLDGKYFDDFPVIRGDMHNDLAGCQYPSPELAESIAELIITVGHRPFAGSKGHVSGQLLL